MTGEVTLRGGAADRRVEGKAACALRGGIKTVLIPEENAKDLAEIPDNVKPGWRLFRSRMSTKCWRGRWYRLCAIEWTEEDDLAAQPPASIAPKRMLHCGIKSVFRYFRHLVEKSDGW